MKKALLITNLNARTVSVRVKQVIVKALSADLDLEVADTQYRNHATELARDAADRGYDLVISFGGDGTMNEVVNGLVGSSTALAVLPGGMANVLCRVLGIPTDIVEATGHLLNRIRSAKTRTINIGKMDDRYFVLSCGAGLDAATVKRTEENPAAKRKYRDWFFLYSAFGAFFRDYRKKRPELTLETEGTHKRVILAVVSNIPEFTYFKNWPVVVTPDARMESGLDVFGLESLKIRRLPLLIWALFRSGSHTRWKGATYAHNVSRVLIETETEPFPVQVDGEFIGNRQNLKVELVPSGITILS